MSAISRKINETLARRPTCLRIEASGGAEFVISAENVCLAEGKIFWEDDVGLWCLPVDGITDITADVGTPRPPGSMMHAPVYWAAGRA